MVLTFEIFRHARNHSESSQNIVRPSLKVSWIILKHFGANVPNEQESSMTLKDQYNRVSQISNSFFEFDLLFTTIAYYFINCFLRNWVSQLLIKWFLTCETLLSLVWMGKNSLWNLPCHKFLARISLFIKKTTDGSTKIKLENITVKDIETQNRTTSFFYYIF